jgi:hypothetical protein
LKISQVQAAACSLSGTSGTNGSAPIGVYLKV